MNPRIDVTSLRGRIDIVQVISHYLHLEKKGTSFVGLCPFHDDKHPSLCVSPAKGVYHCFSCGAGGDAFSFVKEIEGCGFGEALQICADLSHVSTPSPQPVVPPPVVKQEKAQKEGEEPTVEGNERFSKTLLPYDPGCEELKETYERFGVGIGPCVTHHLFGFTRNRLVFPIRDASGQLVAFAGRYLGTDPETLKRYKYLNSKNSSMYVKGRVLYAWHEAEPAVRESGQVFLTEGYKDALAMHAAGFRQTVALCGVTFSADHLALIRGVADTVCLLLDNDAAGRRTAAELTPLLREAGLQVMDLIPEGGKDPDEMFRCLGRQAFAAWIRRSTVPPAQATVTSLLQAACLRWVESAGEGSIPEKVRELLPGEDPLLLAACYPELDRLYEQLTEPSDAEAARRSALIRYLSLCYREICLEREISHDSRRLSLAAGSEVRLACLDTLQRHRRDLRDVSKALHRRG